MLNSRLQVGFRKSVCDITGFPNQPSDRKKVKEGKSTLIVGYVCTQACVIIVKALLRLFEYHMKCLYTDKSQNLSLKSD